MMRSSHDAAMEELEEQQPRQGQQRSESGRLQPKHTPHKISGRWRRGGGPGAATSDAKLQISGSGDAAHQQIVEERETMATVATAEAAMKEYAELLEDAESELEALKRESETTERELREQHATEMAAAQTMIEGLVEASTITAEALEHKRRAGSSPLRPQQQEGDKSKLQSNLKAEMEVLVGDLRREISTARRAYQTELASLRSEQETAETASRAREAAAIEELLTDHAVAMQQTEAVIAGLLLEVENAGGCAGLPPRRQGQQGQQQVAKEEHEQLLQAAIAEGEQKLTALRSALEAEHGQAMAQMEVIVSGLVEAQEDAAAKLAVAQQQQQRQQQQQQGAGARLLCADTWTADDNADDDGMMAMLQFKTQQIVTLTQEKSKLQKEHTKLQAQLKRQQVHAQRAIAAVVDPVAVTAAKAAHAAELEALRAEHATILASEVAKATAATEQQVEGELRAQFAGMHLSAMQQVDTVVAGLVSAHEATISIAQQHAAEHDAATPATSAAAATKQLEEELGHALKMAADNETAREQVEQELQVVLELAAQAEEDRLEAWRASDHANLEKAATTVNNVVAGLVQANEESLAVAQGIQRTASAAEAEVALLKAQNDALSSPRALRLNAAEAEVAQLQAQNDALALELQQQQPPVVRMAAKAPLLQRSVRPSAAPSQRQAQPAARKRGVSFNTQVQEHKHSRKATPMPQVRFYRSQQTTCAYWDES